MILYIKAKPNQRYDKLEKIGTNFQVRLKAAAVDGKANRHLIDYLGEILNMPKSKIVLKKGETSKIKCVEIDADEKIVLEKLNRYIERE
jgi:uncharacterized protein (TIGR00251 family)